MEKPGTDVFAELARVREMNADLMAALEGLQEWAENCLIMSPYPLPLAVEKAAAAIAKAKGETP